jgi:hypothetical protein
MRASVEIRNRPLRSSIDHDGLGPFALDRLIDPVIFL